jgi:low temperature requirement protein LtrA
MVALRTRMHARDTTEQHRVSSPLELLFDLTFVVAIAQLTAQLAHALAQGHMLDLIVPFLMAFFAIWWAWMNFTWFGSSYDADDVPYRLLTMLQMAGVLVLAAGIPAGFVHFDYLTITIGYLIMRVGLVAQWVRAAIEHPAGRSTALRYAAAMSVLQIGWWAKLLTPNWAIPFTLLLIALEISVPPWAERAGKISWHPHHIAERFGLFTIIVLGESVLAATIGLKLALDTGGVSWRLIVVALSALVLLFALWWLYFLEPSGDGLEHHRDRSYLWGYGHYWIFASLAALGAGLEVAVSATLSVHGEALTIGYAVAVPVSLFLVLLWALHVRLVVEPVIRPQLVLPAAAVILMVPLLAGTSGISVVVAAIALICAVLVVATLVIRPREV